jgi:integrase
MSRAFVKYARARRTWRVVIDKHTPDEREITCGRGDEGRTKAQGLADRINGERLEAVAGVGRAPQHGITFGAYAARYLEILEARVRGGSLKPRYYDSVRQAVRLHLNPALRDMALTEIARAHVVDLVTRKLRGAPDAEPPAPALSRNTVRRLIAALSAIYSQALEEQDTTGVTANPAAQKGKLLGRRTKFDVAIDPHQVYDARMVELLFAAAAKWYPDELLAVMTPFLTGMRQGEVFGLQWPDLNYVGGSIELRRQVHYTPDGPQIVSPKNGRPLRSLDAPEELLRRLRERRSLLEAEAVLAGRALSPWVFPYATDPERPMNGNTFYTGTWTKLLEKAGLHHIRYHDARHTFATIALDAGRDIGWVSKQLGHADVGFTGRVYVHWTARRNREHIEAVARAFSRPQLELVMGGGAR